MRGMILAMEDRHMAELLHGNAAVLVLKVLSRGALHVYGIKRELYVRTDGYLGLSEGRLYPLLRRLERRGFVCGRDAVSNTGRRVRQYRISPAGRDELAAQMKAWNLFVGKMNSVLQSG